MGATGAAATDQLQITALEYDLTLPNGVTDPDGARQLHLRISHDQWNDLPDATVTVDTSGLAGVADVVWPKKCTHTGAVGTCTTGVLNVDQEDDPDEYITLGLSAAAGAKDGAHGRITYSAVSGDVSAPQSWQDISVGSGADLVLRPLASVEHAKPGSTVTQHVQWKNAGNEGVRQTVLVLDTMVGLDFAERYSNCLYGAPRGGFKNATAVCTLDTPLEPGQAVELSSDLAYEVTSEALQSLALVKVLPPGPEADAALAAVHGTAGTGPELTATPVASAGKAAPRAAELNPDDNSQGFTVKADNHAHYYAIGAQVSGDKGETVPVTVGLGNEGPATTADLSGGEGVDFVKVTFPAGTTVTEVPDGCELQWKAGVKGHGPYECEGALAQPAGYKATFTFQVRLDEQLADARGTAALTDQESDISGEPVVFPWDDSRDGYTQPIVFNAPAGSGSGSASGGTAGTDAGTTAGSGSGSGTDGGGAAAQTGESGQELAATGAGGGSLLAGAAALLVAAGGAVAMASRRRTPARR